MHNGFCTINHSRRRLPLHRLHHLSIIKLLLLLLLLLLLILIVSALACRLAPAVLAVCMKSPPQHSPCAIEAILASGIHYDSIMKAIIHLNNKLVCLS
jgi:hypothetical protein